MKKGSLLKAHLDYIRDNPDGLWFKRKLYGWGWIPVTWQGWFVVSLLILYIALISVELGNSGGDGFLWFLAKLVAAIAIVIGICLRKGEKPKWMWGLDSSSKK